MTQLETIYFDEVNHRFAILMDEYSAMHFCYWRELFSFDIKYLNLGEIVDAKYSLEKSKNTFRNFSLLSAQIIKENTTNTPIQTHNRENISQSRLEELLNSDNGDPIRFWNCSFEDISIDNLNTTREVLFLNCQFRGATRFINCNFNKNIWFCNSCFDSHFSLKKSQVSGDVHLEACDFSGAGGVSLRGLKAKNIYLDLGVNGPDDMVWLNEMTVEEHLCIGGQFNSEIQVLKQQDPDVETIENCKIGQICVGVELYRAERANRTTISDQLLLEGYSLDHSVHVDNIDAKLIRISGIDANSLELNHCSIVSDLVIDSCFVRSEKNCLVIESSSLGRHFKLNNNKLSGEISFNNSAVNNVTYIDKNTFLHNSSLSILRFTTNRFLINPASDLFKYSSFCLFKPRALNLLKKKSKQENGDEFCALKHWFSDAGQLDMEDIAFFHMRDSYSHNVFIRLFLGRIFGWGVRLPNIAVSALLLILIFAFVYISHDNNLNFKEAFALSSQSFISSFFGNWSKYEPASVMASIVTFESAVGVLMITVFVGAYIRKLLR